MCFSRAAIGKAEGRGDKHHGHVSAVTVSPEYRRIGIAALLMRNLETTSDVVYVSISEAFSLSICFTGVSSLREVK